MIHICDNFFNDPYKVRNLALKQKFVQDTFNYPGVRSNTVPFDVLKYIVSRMGKILEVDSLIVKSSSFQYITEQYHDGIYHYDNADYIGIIYLTPNPPANTGTEVCDSNQVFDTLDTSEVIRLKESFHEDPSNLIKRYRYAKIRKKLNSYYNPIMKVPNKFNRILIFPATFFHRSQNFFGTSIENSRLTLVSFFEK